MTGAHYCFLLVEKGSHRYLARLALNCYPPISTSSIVRIAGMSYSAWLLIVFKTLSLQ
jgi:hypothetical protein